MDRYDIYKDISVRTDGDIYLGVVGPVRTGKSTFITRFMEELVLPNITGKNKKQVAVDEMPQSAGGKTIMTTEPKFVPAEAVTVKIDKAQARVKLIDCVGYLVDGTLGHSEEDKPRLVKTPWSKEPMPFEKAAEFGTQKVIGEHSTIGIVITTDGSFTDLPRANYVSAEERVIKELKALDKPFIVIYNTVSPQSNEAQKLRREMEKKYNVTVLCENVAEMNRDKLIDALGSVLMEFPMRSFDVVLPRWMQVLPRDGKIMSELLERLKSASGKLNAMKNVGEIETVFNDNEVFEPAEAVNLDLARGRARLEAYPKSGVFFKQLTETCQEEVNDEYDLISYVKSLAEAKKKYLRLKDALECAEATGYGVVSPSFEDTELTNPEVVKKSGQYCVRMKAKAKSLHFIRADVETEVSPVYGSKKQCDDFVGFMNKSEEADEIWKTPVFGRPLSAIVSDEVSQKSLGMNDNVRFKLRRAITRAVNDKKSNLICILI